MAKIKPPAEQLVPSTWQFRANRRVPRVSFKSVPADWVEAEAKSKQARLPAKEPDSTSMDRTGSSPAVRGLTAYLLCARRKYIGQ